MARRFRSFLTIFALTAFSTAVLLSILSIGSFVGASNALVNAESNAGSDERFFPMTDYRLALLTIRDHPELLTQSGLVDYTRNQVIAETVCWKDLYATAAVQTRRQNRTIRAESYEWQKLIKTQPDFARGALLNVFLRPDADWSFVQSPDSSVISTFIFSRESIEGRQPEFAANELLPVSKQFLELAASQVPTNLWFERTIPTWKYDFNAKTIRFPDLPDAVEDVMPPVYDPLGKLTPFVSVINGLPADVRPNWNMIAGGGQKDSPEVKPGYPASSPSALWRDAWSTLRLPSPAVLSVDRQLRIASIPMDPASAEQLQRFGNPIRVKVFIHVTHAEPFQDSSPGETAKVLVVVSAKLEKIELENAKGQWVKTLSRGELATPPPLPPATSTVAAPEKNQDTRTFGEKREAGKEAEREKFDADREKREEAMHAKMAKVKACRQKEREQNVQTSAERKAFFDACMEKQ